MTTIPSQDWHQQGLALQQQGRAADAEALYRQVIAREPHNAQALLFLGVLAAQRGDGKQALAAFDKILALGFIPPAIHYNRGVILAGLNRFEEAVAAFDKELAIQPTADCWNNRGAALQSLKRWPEALKSFDAALTLKPDYAQVWVNRGAVLDVLERHAESLAAYERALAIVPDYAQGWNNRGTALHKLGRHQEAVTSFDRAIACAPRYAGAWLNRGLALEKLGRHEEAVASHGQALALDPDLLDAHLNRGRLLCTRLDRPEEALAGYDVLLARQPDCAIGYSHRADAWRWIARPAKALADCDRAASLLPASAEMRTNRGLALMDLGRFDEAMADFDRAIALDPDYAQAHFKKGLLLLLQTRFSEGWPFYERRPLARRAPGPRLRPGDSIAGKTLFIQWEQGYGDIIQISRYAQMAQAAGATVVMSVPDSISRLLRGLNPVIELIAGDAVPKACDFHIPMMSLPLHFGTMAQTIPGAVPYLGAEPERVAKWDARIGRQGFRVGLSWQGNIETDPSRSFPLHEIAPLAKIPDVRFISLQMGSGAAQIDALDGAFNVERLGPDFNAGPDAFIDSAAVMANLDLVISCDTAAAHLAGAMGRPVWTALKYVPDWRWQMNRADCPWYPSMTLFRQAEPGNWGNVFQAMAARLAALQSKA